MAQGKSARLHEHLQSLVGEELKPHDRLPTERDLAGEFEVSRLTVRRVLDRMERDGWVYRVQGSGTFVTEPRVTKSVELTSFSEDMRGRGMTPGSRVVLSETRSAGDVTGWALGISPQTPVWHLRRVRTADEEPMCLEDLVIPAGLLPEGFELKEDQSVYAELSRRSSFKPDHADQTIRASILDVEPARLLDAPPFSAALMVNRLVYDVRGRAIEQTSSLYRADRYNYELRIRRGDRARDE